MKLHQKADWERITDPVNYSGLTKGLKGHKSVWRLIIPEGYLYRYGESIAFVPQGRFSVKLNLKKQVERALRNAAENGHTFPGWKVKDIAEDMIRCDVDFEDCHPTELIPYILDYRG